MTYRLASLLLLPLLAGGCLPRAPEAAVRVEVSYGFKAGCIAVTARDAEDPGREAKERLEVLERGPSTVRLAVYRQESWSHTLELTTTAHEQSCDGPEVARDVRTVKLEKADVQRLAVSLEAPDTDGDGYIALASGGTDCDDAHEASRPGATEVCDDLDNDCDGNVDIGEGLGTLWYPDRDGDTYGDRNATPVRSCSQPPVSGTTRYVKNATDCRDSDSGAYPRANVAETRCDEIDDDCDGTADDGFTLKNTACSDPCAGGQYVCNASRNGLTCNAPQPTPYYPDVDKDGAGDSRSPVQVCPGATQPPGTVANKDDCDDQDPSNRGGGTEVCDDRDNTCNSQRDENNVCAGKGWKVLADTALGGTHQWKTVALGQNGVPVWVAGDGGALAVRPQADQPFQSRDSECGTYNWRAAWVRPSDGHVFLAGDGGRVAEHTGTGTTCNQTTVPSTNNLTALVGFTSGATTLVYVVDALGRMYLWTVGTGTQELYNESPPTYFGVHGMAPSLLLAVGGTLDSNPVAPPYIVGYPGSGDTTALTVHTNNLAAGFNSTLRAVWMGGAALAYSVGDNGLVLKWDGVKNWTQVPAPADNTSAAFTSVVALDPNSTFVTDASGALRRLNPAGWAPPLSYPVTKPLRDLALSSPSDLWLVGDNGHVVHFPE
jgi:hypothetical protein